MKKVLSLLLVLMMAATSSVQALVSDVNANYVASVSTSSTTSITPGHWYVMYNIGRKAYVYGSGQVTATAPTSGTTFSSLASYLVRFVSTGTSGKYVIQNAEGNYFKDLTYNTNAGVTSDSTQAGAFTIDQIVSGTGSWYLQGSTYIMDSNGIVVVGWATSAPTSTTGNSAWRIFPVEVADPSSLTGGAKITYELAQGGLYRIYNRNRTNQYIVENTTTSRGTTGAKASQNMSQMWIIEHDGKGFTFRNAQTGNYLQDDYTCKNSKYYWIAQLSPNNTSSSDEYIILCHANAVEAGKKTCANLNGGNSGLTDWYYDNDRNSEWLLEAVASTETDTATVKANLDRVLGVTPFDLQAGSYYRFKSLNTGGMLAENLSDNNLITMAEDSTSWNEYWKVAYDSTAQTYTIQSIYSSRYINHKAINENSACNGAYVTSNTNEINRSWLIQLSSYAWQSTYVMAEPNKPATGLGLNGTTSANVSIESTNAQWIPQRVDLTAEQLDEASNAYDEYRLLRNTSTQLLNNRLQTYFDDWACTKLKDEYQAMNDDSLRARMSASELPRMLINMALKIKNDTWGHREKEFRIYDYQAYSDPTRWNATSLAGTGYQLSPQTGPTGISVKQGDVVVLLVGANPIANSTLSFSSNKGYTVNASQTTLRRGINVFIAQDEGFLFIHHIITNVNSKLADFPAITVHIEGGRVQGYFDITRGHTNADWKDFQANLFKDEILHMKGYRYEHNINYQDFINKQLVQSELDEVDANGDEKGVVGILRYWDKIVNEQNYLMGLDQFKDRFNCMYSASSSSTGNPYASSYGTYYPGVDTEWNYERLNHGRENDGGANYWCIAHETGHVNQGLIKLCGTTEISNNFFSQVNTWLQGSNVGRYRPWSEVRDCYQEGRYWLDYGVDVGTDSRMYFQLWLYFHLAKNDTTFYPRLFDKFRQTPITFSRDSLNPSSGTTDVLRFAKFACDVAQADLSEFFRFWGFFVPIKNRHIGDYGNFYMTTTQAEIDDAIAYMHQYKKKLGNILFIDERIKQYPAEYVGAPEGTMRLATTAEATPGDASEVGETGMFTEFMDVPNYQQYSCTIRPRDHQCIISSSSGTGAVGFKVYDNKGILAYASNTYRFTVPSTITGEQYYIVAARGDGSDRLIYVNGADSTTSIKVYNANHEVIKSSTTRTYSIPSDIANDEYYVMAVKSDGSEALVYETTEGLSSSTTGINTATATDGSGAFGQFNPAAPAYTVDGKRVTEFQKGQIYIQNGSKVRY